MARVDLNLLTLFEVVLTEGHVGRAAERLHLSPSAVSHGLNRLRLLLHDPLFLRTPKGVVPSARAAELAAPVADVLARARTVLASAERFDPARSTRRFTLGTPDSVATVLLPPLLAAMRRTAPGIGLALRQVLPAPGDTSFERAWQPALTELESRSLDVAVLPHEAVPARFHAQPLFEEDFVVGMRTGHPLTGRRLTFARWADAQHLVVSLHGDAHGFVDDVLARQGLTRRVVLTVPNFMFALAVLADTDLVAALPRGFVAQHGGRLGVVAVEPPVALGRLPLQLVTPRAAMMDAGVAWFAGLLAGVAAAAPARRRGRAARRDPDRRSQDL